jgi:1,4-alpha-glucan branching enzyme
MNHNHNHDHGRRHDNSGHSIGPGPKLVSVNFQFTDPTARTVAVAGTFNDWHPTTKSMQSSGSGHWLKEAFLAPGTYEYCLVVDGQWRQDPLAKESVANPFGGRNSVLIVPSC